jgi:two-component system, NarL family, sensor histidine kinase UhpB
VSLFWRIALLNAVLPVAATALLVFGPVSVSTPVRLTEVLILCGGLVAVLLANAVLLRVGLAPVDRLVRVMTTTDLLRPGPRLDVAGHGGIASLIRTFNSMLDRLEAERSESSARALSAQEAERRRIAQELHDEVGQTLTAVLLELKRAADLAPPRVREELLQAQDATREGLDEIRRIARRLRPGVLEELGLASALRELTAEIPSRSGLCVVHRFDHDLLRLDREAELVVYRVAQESITNTVRHARAKQLEFALTSRGAGLELCVRDDGRGIGGAGEGAGIRGMRERALLIGADLTVGPGPGGGTEVLLLVPAADGGDQ